MPAPDNFIAYITDVSNAQNEVRDLTFEIARETESQEVRDAITRIREQLTDSFGIVHQNALNRVNADIKNLGKRPNIPQPQIPNYSELEK